MAKLNLSYHRPGWKTCIKTQEFLANHEISAATEINAKKEKYQKSEALRFIADANELFVAKGKKVVHLDLKKDKPTEDEILKLVLGPTGNLRAPTLVVGKKLVVGFEQRMYEQAFGC